jgi:hypothetical protein
MQPNLPRPARVKYLDNGLQVIEPGSFVVCAVTGQPIPLGDLRYWSVDLQEPYWDAAAAVQRLVTAKAP